MGTTRHWRLFEWKDTISLSVCTNKVIAIQILHALYAPLKEQAISISATEVSRGLLCQQSKKAL